MLYNMFDILRAHSAAAADDRCAGLYPSIGILSVDIGSDIGSCVLIAVLVLIVPAVYIIKEICVRAVFYG